MNTGKKDCVNAMKLLIDINVLLDIVLKRNNYETAMNVFFKAKENNTKAYITASSATDLFYQKAYKNTPASTGWG